MAKQRARGLGIPFDGTPGEHDAITDIAGVEVGQVTIDEGRAHTGVTVIWPRGRTDRRSVFAGFAPLNGNGEMTGMHWVKEGGVLDGPIATTSSLSVGTVHEAIGRYLTEQFQLTNDDDFGTLPVIGETWDGYVHDIRGFHLGPQHVTRALAGAKGGPVDEGNVGGGTGMLLFGYKGGIGTASRRLPGAEGYTVGVLAQCNFGDLPQLTVAGVPVGAVLAARGLARPRPARKRAMGSILVIIATDAPLLPHQLERLARRATHGLARTGSISEDGSGDLFLAFSTANAGAIKEASFISDHEILDGLFAGVVQATEESIINALVAAETMTGWDGTVYPAIDTELLQQVLRAHGRLA